MKTKTQLSKLLPFVSVIIPVYNDTEALAKCLCKLSDQTYPQLEYEVIVVDNNSIDDISISTTQYKRIIYTTEQKIGSYAARNKGISLAKGTVLAFIDSDCIPEKDWIEQGVSALNKSQDSSLVGGKVVFLFANPKHITAIERYDSITYFNMKKNIEESHFIGTGNLFVYKNVMEDVGLFNDALKSGGDREWGNRAYDKGYKLVYSDKTIVSHPARNSYQEIFFKAMRIAGGLHLITNTMGKQQPFIKRMLPPVHCIVRIIMDKRVPSPWEKIKVILIVVSVKYVCLIEEVRLTFGGSARRS